MAKSIYGTSLLALAVVLTGGSAIAQTSAGGSGPAQILPGPADEGTAGDIIVTAQRRAERVQDVPIAVSAVTADTLARAGARDVTDLGASIPALKITANNGQLAPRLRGIGSTGTGPGVENSIALYVDGVYFGAPNASVLQLNNVERVEVLKGPQGTLFGRNATGGLVQIITRTPSHTPSMEFNVGYGNYKTVNANAYVTGGLTDTIAMDLAATYTHQGEGYGVNRGTGNPTFQLVHDFAVRSKLVFEPTDLTRFTLAGDYASTKSSMNAFVLLPGTRAVPGGPLAPDDGWNANTNHDSYIDGWQAGGSLTIDQKIGSLSFMSLTAYRDAQYNRAFDFDATNNPVPNTLAVIPYRYFKVPQPDRQFSQEFQLSSPSGGPFTWVLGAYYYNAKSGYNPVELIFESGLLQRVVISSQVRTKSYAGYGQGTLALGENTNLTLGLRYTNERKSVSGTQSRFLLPSNTPAPIGPIIPQPALEINKLTYRASLDHHFSRDVMVFASFNRGFKSGGFAAAAPSDPGYLPEELDAYEVGIKSELFDRHLRLNLSAFHYDYTNIQIQRVSGAGTITTNGPSAKINGLDFEADARFGGFSISGGVTLVDDKFGNYPNAVITTATGGQNFIVLPPPGPGAPPTVLPVTGSATGHRLPLSQRATVSISPQYTVELAGGGKIDFTGGYLYSSGWYSAADNVIRQKAFAKISASVKWSVNDNFSISAWGKNLTNERTFAGQAVLPYDRQVTTWDPPRTYGVSLGAKF